MADATAQRQAATARALTGPGKAALGRRRAAFDNQGVSPEPARALIDKVAIAAYKVTDDDVAAVTAAGLGEDEIFELVVCAAFGQATRQIDAALAALAAVEDA